MTPAEFTERWGTPLIRYRPELLEGCGIREETFALLTEAGIPTDPEYIYFLNPERFLVAPHFLDFDEDDEAQAHLRNLLHIGDDAGGNPVCIDRKQGDSIIWLDHEDDYAPTFVNSSLRQLFAFLLLRREPAENTEVHTETLAQIDAPAVKPGAYWHHIIQHG